MNKNKNKNETETFVLACVVKGKTNTGMSGQISKELLDELYEIFDRIVSWQTEHGLLK